MARTIVCPNFVQLLKVFAVVKKTKTENAKAAAAAAVGSQEVPSYLTLKRHVLNRKDKLETRDRRLRPILLLLHSDFGGSLGMAKVVGNFDPDPAITTVPIYVILDQVHFAKLFQEGLKLNGKCPYPNCTEVGAMVELPYHVQWEHYELKQPDLEYDVFWICPKCKIHLDSEMSMEDICEHYTKCQAQVQGIQKKDAEKCDVCVCPYGGKCHEIFRKWRIK